MDSKLLDYYRAIENASVEMLHAAQTQDWEQVVRLEGACAVLIGQLNDRANSCDLKPHERSEKSKIMQRILQNDAKIRYLAEPWLEDLEQMLQPRKQFLH